MKIEMRALYFTATWKLLVLNPDKTAFHLAECR